MDPRELLQQIKVRLQEAFGPRLRGVVLYGSEALGETRKDNDIDVLLSLEGPIQLGRNIHVSVQALYPLILQRRVIDAVPMDVGRYEAAAMALDRQAKREGIRA
jgi:predicted nucleotidyltransferase